MNDKQDLRCTRFYLIALIFMTAAAGNTAPARADIIEDPAIGPALAVAGPKIEARDSGGFWKISPAQAEKFLRLLRRNSIAFKLTRKEKPVSPLRKTWDPFRAARAFMTSA